MQIDENKRPRTALKTYFAKNAIPTEGQFAQLIESSINQRDDGLVKAAGDPLSIEATGDDVGLKRAVNFYMSFADADPAWTISLRPRSKPADPNTGRAGWSISDAAGNSRLCVDAANGNVGIGTISPADKLEVAGRVRAGTATMGTWPANTDYSYFGSGALDQRQPGNYALLQQNNANGFTFVNSPTRVGLRIGNVDRLVVENDGVTVNGSVTVGGSDIYFTQTNHNHTGIGNAPGCAAIENGANYGALMILGRNVAAAGNVHRVVKVWDQLDVNGTLDTKGDMSIHGKHAFRGNDGWLRLNQDGAFPHGTHTPRLFAPMSINVGAHRGWEFDPGRGSIAYSGQLSKLDVASEFTAVVRCADFTIGGVPGRRAQPGRAIVDLGDTLALNFADDWPKTTIGGDLRARGIVTHSSAALKKDIRPITSDEARDIVEGLDPVSFRWKDKDAGPCLGFVAEKSPEPVTTAERDGIHMSHIVAALIRVVRDQTKTIAELKDRLDAINAEPA